MNHATSIAHLGNARGFSLVEAVIATAIVGGLLVAALTGVGATARTRQINADNATGLRLAQDLLDEVVAKPYFDPEESATLGREVGEDARASFDDVDDYDALVDDPPTTPDARAITTQRGWKREVLVRWATRADIDADAKDDEGIKRVEIFVSRNGKPICSLVALRTAAWDQLMEER